MTDAEYESQKQRVEDLLGVWLPRLGLDGWRIVMVYQRENGARELVKNQIPIFEVYCDWRYLDAEITCFLPVLLEMDDQFLEHCLLHEFAHLFLEELRDHADPNIHCNHEERVATMLARSWQLVRDDVAPKEENALSLPVS